jgi:hypothetical protein
VRELLHFVLIMCTDALTWAEDLGISKLIISSDCLDVINMMKEVNLCRYSSILLEVKERSRGFEDVRFRYDSRETNEDAHLVARNSISQDFGRHVWFLGRHEFVPDIIHEQ